MLENKPLSGGVHPGEWNCARGTGEVWAAPGGRTEAGRQGRCSGQREALGHEEQKTRLALAGLWEMNQISRPGPTVLGQQALPHGTAPGIEGWGPGLHHSSGYIPAGISCTRCFWR